MQGVKIQINKKWSDLENIPILFNYVAIEYIDVTYTIQEQW